MALRKHTKVFTVFSFLRLKSPDIKWYQWVYPTILSAGLLCSYYWFGETLLVSDDSELLQDINSLMGILIGFYIAALAAVSSFTNENLDKIMKGRAPTLSSTRQGSIIQETLTRRRFLSVLFGYCASLSIALYIYGVLASHVSVELTDMSWGPQVIDLAKSFGQILYTWGISSLLVTTLLSLHYLVERMHRA